MSDSTKALFGAAMACLTIVEALQIMASCSIKVNNAQIDAAECAKRGGIWHPSADPTARFCEEGARK